MIHLSPLGEYIVMDSAQNTKPDDPKDPKSERVEYKMSERGALHSIGVSAL